MNLLLFDIFDIDTSLRGSETYLNKSFEYVVQNYPKQNHDLLTEEVLRYVREESNKKQIKDTPLNWFTLNVLKSLKVNNGIISDKDFINSIFHNFLNPDSNTLGVNSLNFTSNSFSYSIPVNLCQSIKLEFQDWQTFNSAEIYEEWEQYFASAVELIQKINPDITAHLNKLIKYILAVKSKDESHGSMSPKNIIGTIFLPEIKDYTLLAECLIHEGLHQYLYRLEHCAALFNEGEDLKELYYSPWKDEPRPLIMVLHGAFVFTGVALFYNQLLKMKIENKWESIFMERMIKRTTQTRIAIEVLLSNNHLSNFGQQIVMILKSYLDEISDLNHVDFHIDVDEILDHKIKFSKKNYLHVNV